MKSGFQKAGIFPYSREVIDKTKYDPEAYKRYVAHTKSLAETNPLPAHDNAAIDCVEATSLTEIPQIFGKLPAEQPPEFNRPTSTEPCSSPSIRQSSFSTIPEVTNVSLCSGTSDLSFESLLLETV